MSDKTDAPELPEHDETPLADSLGLFGKIDRWIYRIETVVVVAALVVMSILVFTDVVYQLSVTLDQYFAAGDPKGYTLTLILSAFLGAMGWASAAARPTGVRAGIAVAWVIGFSIFAYVLLVLESSTVYRLTLIGFGIPIVLKFKERGETRRMGVFITASVLAFIAFGKLPTGFSWSQSYSLLLLLWVGFLGASMAARDRRHLRVDLARKTLSPEKLPLFNTVSYLAAAAFSAVILYLSFEYIFGYDSSYITPIWDAPAYLPESLRETLMSGYPLPEDASVVRRIMQVIFSPSEPGEIPDWLKVLAIPVSFLLITIRFLGHAFVFARMTMAGESYSETAGAH